MKFKYSKAALVFQWSVVIAFALLLFLGTYFRRHDMRLLIKDLMFLTVFSGAYISIFNGEYVRRCVEFSDEYVRFTSFRIPQLKTKKPVTIGVAYGDIMRIKAIKLPIFGVIKIRVYTPGVPCGIPVNFFLCKHNELFAELVKRCEMASTNTEIDDALIKHLERKGLL